ncbi:hypothetical protein [Thalassomonas sp. M1454]|uniref:hypothetical protein n=1 Tax=Thalassomonas sp. M1454 TaxID=2594477 RepID=UPI00117DD824|nr:hypothetical protein [Thalassomonas sp. M1454]TRX57025.1 hypothetical protein FNN08_05845 [Thalassomonas sp. M1454]
MKKFRVSLTLLAFMALFYGYTIYQSPLPFEVIDRDNSGIISVEEATQSMDIDKRVVIKTDEICTIYYWLDDGSDAYEVCAVNN